LYFTFRSVSQNADFYTESVFCGTEQGEASNLVPSGSCSVPFRKIQIAEDVASRFEERFLVVNLFVFYNATGADSVMGDF
jgi:hypothetical protein